MKSAQATITTELAAVWACITALAGCTDNKAKGLFLLTSFEKSPALIKYFRAMYDENYIIKHFDDIHFTAEARANWLKLPKELRELVNFILSKQELEDLPLGLLNKVLVKLARQPIPKWRPAAGENTGLVLEFGTEVQGVAVGVLYYDGIRVANFSIILKPWNKYNVFDLLRKADVEIKAGPGASAR